MCVCDNQTSFMENTSGWVEKNGPVDNSGAKCGHSTSRPHLQASASSIGTIAAAAAAAAQHGIAQYIQHAGPSIHPSNYIDFSSLPMLTYIISSGPTRFRGASLAMAQYWLCLTLYTIPTTGTPDAFSTAQASLLVVYTNSPYISRTLCKLHTVTYKK